MAVLNAMIMILADELSCSLIEQFRGYRMTGVKECTIFFFSVLLSRKFAL